MQCYIRAMAFQGVDFLQLDDLLTDEELLVRDTVRSFVDDQVIPIIEDHFMLGTFPEHLIQPMAELGFLGANLDGYGCAGLNNISYGIIMQELERGDSGLRSFVSVQGALVMYPIHAFGSKEQKEKWLKPLLAGEIRSAFAMTEPDMASSDAKNISTSAVLENGEWVINGEKYYISGAGDPRCKIMITMVKTSPDAEPFRQQSQILVPIDTPGVEIVGPMHVFGHDDAPHGHMHIKFTNVRVPEENILWGEGKGFEISQVRLGPGRIHHCMRSIGAAEKALDLMIERGLSREAFGKKIIDLGKNMETISRAKIEIEAMRLMVLKAAKAMDVLGNKEARIWVSMIKAMVPEKVCNIIDQAMQVHGATGISQWSPLSGMYTSQRTLRYADGPDEVHHHVIARAEVKDYQESNLRTSRAREEIATGRTRGGV
mgnify:CR=1 FL=1